MSNKIKAITLEAVVGSYPLRLTECGGIALKKGDKVVVTADLAQVLIAQHPDHLKQVGDVKEVDKLAHTSWEPFAKASEKTATATEKGGPSEKGKAGNKSMDGQAEEK